MTEFSPEVEEEIERVHREILFDNMARFREVPTGRIPPGMSPASASAIKSMDVIIRNFNLDASTRMLVRDNVERIIEEYGLFDNVNDAEEQDQIRQELRSRFESLNLGWNDGVRDAVTSVVNAVGSFFSYIFGGGVSQDYQEWSEDIHYGVLKIYGVPERFTGGTQTPLDEVVSGFIDESSGEFRFNIDFNELLNPGPIIISNQETPGYSDGSLVFSIPAFPTFGFFNPVVLDLDGDGIELTSPTESDVFFDIDNDGYLERHGWVDPDDGILAIDLNANGVIDGPEEYAFSWSTPSDDTDMQALAALYDSNGDGILGGQDLRFADFRIWRDLNSDGIGQVGEVTTLNDAAIYEINLQTDHIPVVISNNLSNGQSDFVRGDGTAGIVADVSLVGIAAGIKIENDGPNTTVHLEGKAARVIFKDDVERVIDLEISGYESVIAGNGSDVLSTSGTADVSINGGGGDDIISGGVGADILQGGAGTDVIHGGDGDDVLILDAADLTHLENVDGGDGNDVAVLDGSDSIAVDLNSISVETFYAGAGDDSLSSSGGTPVVIFGGAGNDSIVGGSGDDVLSGGDGADSIAGGAGDDLLIADSDDTVDGGSGVDTVVFTDTTGVTMNLAQAGIEIAFGGDGDDVFSTDLDTARVMSGRGGNDSLTGGQGADVFSGGAGDDFMSGGAGDDTYLFGRGDGHDTIRDRQIQAVDVTIQYFQYWGVVAEFNGSPIAVYDVNQNFAGYALWGSSISSINPSLDTFYNNVDASLLEIGVKENLDQLFTQADMNARMQAIVDLEYENGEKVGFVPAYQVNTIDGPLWVEAATLELPPDTTIITHQTIETNAGSDTLVFSGGVGVEDLRLQFGYGQNPLNLNNAQLGDQDGDGVYFEDYDSDGQIDEVPTYPVIWADFPTSSLDLYVGLADDENPDALASELDDYVRVESFIDVLNVSGSSPSTLFTSDAERSLETFAFDGGLTIDVSSMMFWTAWAPSVVHLNFDSNNYAAFYQYDAATTNEWIAGTLGDDTIYARGGNDVVVANAGNDTILGADGNDRLYGGDGADIIAGGAGTDYLSGGAGDDTLTGGGGDDCLDGGSGADAMAGSSGDDSYVVDNIGDVVTEATGAGTDTIHSSISISMAENVENLILTGSDDLSATGNSLDNDIRGNAGTNVLAGGGGGDRLAGGGGDDSIDGGAGIDTAVFLGDRSDYHVSRDGDAWIVSDGDPIADGYEGTDNLVNVELIEFGDETVDLATLNSMPLAAADTIGALESNELVIDPVTLLSNDFDADEGDSLTITAVGSATNGQVRLENGNVIFTPQLGYVGQSSFRYTVSDASGALDSALVTVNVIANQAPTLVTPIDPQAVLEDAMFSFVVPANTFDDVDAGDALTFSATRANGSSLPSWLSFDAATGTFSGTPANEDVGSLTVRVTATDIALDSAYADFTLTVENTDDAPVVFVSPSGQIATEDSAFNFTVPADTFIDVDVGDTLTYAATFSDGSALPSWLAFDPATRTFTGTPENDQVGTVTIRVVATDTAGASATANFVTDVANTNDAPVVLSTVADQSIEEDAAFTFTFPADVFGDVDTGDTLVYTTTRSGGDPLPSWLTFDAATRTFSGTPENDDVGVHTYTLTANDAAGASISTDFSISVVNTNDAPVVSLALIDRSVTEDTAFSFALPVNAFTDVDAGDTLTYTATLSGGSALPEWLAFDAATQTFSGTPPNADIGEHVVSVTATDGAGASVSSDFTLDVARFNNAPTVLESISDLSVDEDAAVTFAVPTGTFADPDTGDVLTYTATLADGSALPAWLNFDALTQTFSGTPENGDVGEHSVRVTATDTMAASASTTFILTVANTNDAPVVASAIGNQITDEDALLTFVVPETTFSDIDAGDILTYAASLADGSVLPAWLSFDQATRTFSGTPANADVGAVAVRVVATDAAGAAASADFVLEVANVNDVPVVASAVPDQSVDEDTPFSFVVPAGTFADPDVGDTLTYMALLSDGTPLPSWLGFDAETRTLSGTPGNGDVGELDVRIVATDAIGETASADFTLSVNNVNDAPVSAAPADQTATEDTSFNFVLPTGTFTDVDAGDTLIYTAALSDGSALPTWLSFDEATRTFSGTPQNGDVGVFSVRVVATDNAGVSAFADFDIDVENVNDAPTVVTAIPNQSTNEDAAFSFTIPAGAFGDVDAGDTLTYTVTMGNGDPLVSWLSFDAATRTFSGTPGNADVGVRGIKVTATDAAGASVSDQFNLTVVNTNDAPVAAGTLHDQNATGNQPFSFQVPAGAFTDVDAGDALTYSATLADGSPLPSWLSFNPATRTFAGTPTTSSAPAYAIKVTATDQAGASASSNFDLSVTTNQGNETYDGVALTGLIDGGPGIDAVSYATAPSAVAVNLATGGTAGAAIGDTYVAIEGIVGSDFDDTLVGNSATNLIAGGAGADTIDGKGGTDWALYADSLVGIDANLTAGTVVAGGVTDTLIRIEAVYGSTHNDKFNGTSGNDAFRGNGGIDQAAAAGGNDIYFADATGRMFIEDRIYSELIVHNGKYVSTYEATLGDAGQDVIAFGEGVSLADIIISQTESEGYVDLEENQYISPAVGTNLNATFIDDTLASSSADMLSGAGVTILGWFSYTPILYEISNPTSGLTRVETFRFADGLEFDASAVSVAETDLSDVSSSWTGTSAAEWYSGRGGNDTINGGSGNDILVGGSGNDTVYGGSGNDVLAGGSGNDVLRGQAGYDTYSFGRGDGQDTIQRANGDAAGGALIFGEDIAADQLWFSQDWFNLTISVVGTNETVTINNFFDESVTREVTEIRAGGLVLDASFSSTAVQQLVSAMAAFSPPPVGQLELSSSVRDDANVSAALAAWAA